MGFVTNPTNILLGGLSNSGVFQLYGTNYLDIVEAGPPISIIRQNKFARNVSLNETKSVTGPVKVNNFYSYEQYNYFVGDYFTRMVAVIDIEHTRKDEVGTIDIGPFPNYPDENYTWSFSWRATYKDIRYAVAGF